MDPIELGLEARKRLRKFVRSLDPELYDLLLVGDGLGETYREPAGWACIAYDRLLKRAVVHAGAFPSATRGAAELFPCIHSLWVHQLEHDGEKLRGCQVVIITDSEVTARCGNREYKRRANGCFWAGIEWFEWQAYVIRWHHVRLSNVWNEFVNTLGGVARSATTNLNLVARRETRRLLADE